MDLKLLSLEMATKQLLQGNSNNNYYSSNNNNNDDNNNNNDNNIINNSNVTFNNMQGVKTYIVSFMKINENVYLNENKV